MSDPQNRLTLSPKATVSALTLANAAVIVSGVMRGIAGKNVANSINGQTLGAESVAQMTCARMVKNLTERCDQAKRAGLPGYN